MLSYSLWSSANRLRQGWSDGRDQGRDDGHDQGRGQDDGDQVTGSHVILQHSQYSRMACGAVLFVCGVIGNVKWSRDYRHYVGAMLTALWVGSSGALVLAYSKGRFRQGWEVLTVLSIISTLSSTELLMTSINHMVFCNNLDNNCFSEADRYFSRSLDGVLAAVSVYLLCASLMTASNLWRFEESIARRMQNILDENNNRASGERRTSRDSARASEYDNPVFNLSTFQLNQIAVSSLAGPPPPYEPPVSTTLGIINTTTHIQSPSTAATEVNGATRASTSQSPSDGVRVINCTANQSPSDDRGINGTTNQSPSDDSGINEATRASTNQSSSDVIMEINGSIAASNSHSLLNNTATAFSTDLSRSNISPGRNDSARAPTRSD